MFKKSLLLLLALTLVVTMFVGCNFTDDDDEDVVYKIGIMTNTVTQNEEEFRMAQTLQEKYGADRILHTTIPDRFTEEVEVTISNMLTLASDPDVKVIIMVQAVQGAIPAVQRCREQRPDILYILGSPQDDPDVVAEVADIVINTDDLGRGYQIVEHAANMGAEVLVHYTFPRHMSVDMLAERRRLMAERAQQLGILFVDEDAPDPTSEAGTTGTQQFIMEDVPRKIAQYGPNTAVFGTNCAMMEPLIRQSIANGGIFPVQCCPSPYHALPSALAIQVPDEYKGNVPWMMEQIREAVVEAGAGGRVATWPVPVNMMFIEASVEYGWAYIDGETNGMVDKAKLTEIMEGIAGGGVQLTEYRNYDNYFLYLSDHIIFE